jgi:phosphoribosyl-dephospho-CoA transferase
MGFAAVLPALLGTMTEALKADEDQGKVALESMAELTGTHPEIWKDHVSQLLTVISQVMSAEQLEDGTRASAVEVILSLTVEMPAPVRKAPETASMFFPALVKMLMEVEKDDETWINSAEEDEISATGPSSTAIDALKRISIDLGEKTILAIIQPIIG